MIKQLCLVTTLFFAANWSAGGISADELKLEPSIVELRRSDDCWCLLRNGKPYYVRGAAGMGPLNLLAQCGGNSNRSWGVGDDTKKRLDEAHRNGISVALGIWIEHERVGFDYQDFQQVSEQIDKVLDAVRKYKDHPAVLLWGIGNEMEGYAAGDNPAIWSHIEHLCKLVKQEDPLHPTMSVVAEIGGNRVKAIHKLCPSLDIIGINAYAGAATIPERYKSAGGTKPYIVTEFGPAGPWEVERDNLDAVIEETSNQKAKQYRATYESLSRDREFCLGSYAFIWGHKQEATATWFGILLADGRKTNVLDDMTELWSGTAPSNLCPRIDSLQLIGENEVDSGDTLHFELAANDPEGSTLAVEWVVQPEADAYVTAGDFQASSEPIRDCIVKSDTLTAVVKAPEQSGLYRLYAYVSDGSHAAAVANLPFRVRRKELSEPGATTELPFVVYDESELPRKFNASTEPGENSPAEQDLACKFEPKFGTTCVRCQHDGSAESDGISWQHPAHDSGDLPGGLDLTGAKRLTLWAKGKTGDEELIIGIGQHERDKKYFDTTFKRKAIKLTPHWKKFQVDFANADLRRIKTGFYWNVKESGKPVEFYLDRIVIE